MFPLHAIQKARLSRFGVTQCVDIHCHILPGIDDGPADLDASLALARALVRDGITTVIATPHQLGRYDGQNLAADVRKAMQALQKTLDAKKIPLRILSGAEVRIDERIIELIEEDRILTLADGKKFLLLELPSTVAIDPESVAPRFAKAGVTIVLAHAERYENLRKNPELAKAWIDAGAMLQINAGGLVGEFGRRAEKVAWDWLSRGWVSLIATDAHGAATRRPCMTDAIDAITARLGEDVARRACIENPIRILEEIVEEKVKA